MTDAYDKGLMSSPDVYVIFLCKFKKQNSQTQ